jgi:hypothetical protein
MSHTIGNLEHHHFKYDVVPPAGRRAHVHMLRHGDAVRSPSGIRTEDGDVFEIESEADFGLPLRNPLAYDRRKKAKIAVTAL